MPCLFYYVGPVGEFTDFKSGSQLKAQPENLSMAVQHFPASAEVTALPLVPVNIQ